MGSEITLRNKLKKKFSFDVLINSHCNLNCKFCNRKAPICSPQYYSLEQFDKDLKHFKDNGVYINDLTFTGGEPLLNKNLEEYFQIARKYYPNCFLKVFTNCKLLQKDSKILKILKDNNIFVLYTQYILSGIDYKKVFENLKKYQIPYSELLELLFNKKDYKFFLTYTPISKEHKDPNKQFENCKSDCLCIRNGILYICGELANIDEMNKVFGTDFKLVENSDFFYINNLNVETLCNAIGKPLNFCKYCSKENVKVFKWSKSNKEKSEWILE